MTTRRRPDLTGLIRGRSYPAILCYLAALLQMRQARASVTPAARWFHCCRARRLVRQARQRDRHTFKKG